MSSVEEARTSETELKFEVESHALARLRKHPVFAAGSESEKLKSVYFDTPDHDLRNAGLTLRVREKGGRFIQTVKTRAGPGLIERGEWETAVPGARPDAAALAHTPAAGLLSGFPLGDLKPVFSTTVQRAVCLWDHGAAQVEIAIDRGEIRAAASREPIRELELELKAGEPSALFVLAQELAGVAPIRLSFDTKAERGYRLAGHDAAASIKADEAELGPDIAAADAFRLAARSCLIQVVAAAQVLRRGRSGHALHQTRVGLRRMRAVLAIFKPLASDARFEWVKAEAKWLAGELDRARNLDVFIEDTLGQDDEDALRQDAAIAAFTRRLLAAQAAAYDQALAAIESQRFSTFLLEVTAWLEVGDWGRAPGAAAVLRDLPAGRFAAGALETLHDRVVRRGRHLKRLEPEARHQLRISAKKLRYAAELFAGTFPDHPKRRHRYLEALKALQDRLGALNDLAVSGHVAMEAIGKRGTEAAFAAGLLIGRRSRSERDMLDKAADAFDRLKDAGPFWA